LGAVAVRTGITNYDMNSAKDANTGLYRLLNIWFIEEAIMDELPPGDVHRFRNAIVKPLTRKNKMKHMHPLKMIIPDRKWIEKMCQDGYTLTIVTPHMMRIMDPNRHMNETRNVSLSLIATKNERIFPLTNELMPRSVFGMRFECAPHFVDSITQNMEPDSRVIKMDRNGIRTTIITPMVDMSTWTPMFLNETLYRDVINSYDGKICNRTMESTAGIDFMHLSRNGFKEGFVRGRKIGDTRSNTALGMNLFAIQTMISYRDVSSFLNTFTTVSVLFDVVE
jgi:hypothetical protein